MTIAYPVSYRQVERNIKAYPAWKRTARALEEEFLDRAAAGPPPQETRVMGGDPPTPQFTLLELQERSPLYRGLARNCAIFERAFVELPEEEREFVGVFFWRDMSSDTFSHADGVAKVLDISRATVWRWRNQVLETLEPLLRDVDPTILGP